ncbi:rhomboid family intramembrane serine protease [Candidatus Poribacteria bacterium]|nr:MAG: rhomboid family intramembrane serine protease [Candidatus Poribacteria bacterium]
MIPLRDNIPSRTFPVITVSLIAANSLVFLYEVSLGPRVVELVMRYGLIPVRFFYTLARNPFNLDDALVPIFTSMFLHGGWAHIIGNMIFLWIFGDNVEDRMGHFRFLIFYLLCGVSAAMAQAFTHPASGVPMVGASGAISGVMGAYFLLFPTARILTLVPVFIFLQIAEVPALFFLGLWFLMQFVNGVFSLGFQHVMGSGVAWWAHIGGFVAGMVLVWFFKRPERKRYPDEYQPW